MVSCGGLFASTTPRLYITSPIIYIMSRAYAVIRSGEAQGDPEAEGARRVGVVRTFLPRQNYHH